MHSILVILKTPDPNNLDAVARWNDAKATILRSILPSAAVEELGEGTFWIRASSGLPTAGIALMAAQKIKAPCRVVFVEACTEWTCP